MPDHISLSQGLVSGRCMLTNENESQDFAYQVLTERDSPSIPIDLEFGKLENKLPPYLGDRRKLSP